MASLPNNDPEFFKIYLPGLSSQMMRIPPDFIPKFGVSIPALCTLKMLRGGCWRVDTEMIDDNWFWVNVWPEFVQQNSLKDADFLTFRMLENSTFVVTIFAPNGWLKGYMSTDYEASESDDSGREEGAAVKPRKKFFIFTQNSQSCKRMYEQFDPIDTHKVEYARK